MPAQVGQRDSASLRKGLNDRVHTPWRGPTVAVSTEGALPGGAWPGAARGAIPVAADTTARITAARALTP